MALMNVREAKDFLVQQAVEQAFLEHVPFSDLEKRMMYFTETGECPEDPIELNSAFEAEYDSAEYEKKVSTLLRHAFLRLKKENPQSIRTWNAAIQELQKGDHYILLFLPQHSSKGSKRMWPMYLIGGMAVAALISLLFFFFGFRGISKHAPADRYIPALSPVAQHILQFSFLIALVFAIFPQLFLKLAHLLPRVFPSTMASRRKNRIYR
jgi:hypothetical protein